ncbi:MAG: OB-fold domain-containing protein [Nitrospirae bacterium]|nr:OB-fold domain-containing protein [Nitrospirota bacterium]
MPPERAPFLPNVFEIPAGPGDPPRLLGARCAACGLVMFPIRPWCIRCFTTEVQSINLSDRGTLYSYAICRVPLPHLPGPYAIGYIDLPEGVRVFALLDQWKEDDLMIGRPMELTAGPLREQGGKEIWCYKFRPAT